MEIPIISALVRALTKEKPIKQVKVVREPKKIGEGDSSASDARNSALGTDSSVINDMNDAIIFSNEARAGLEKLAQGGDIKPNNLKGELIVDDKGNIKGIRVK